MEKKIEDSQGINIYCLEMLKYNQALIEDYICLDNENLDDLNNFKKAKKGDYVIVNLESDNLHIGVITGDYSNSTLNKIGLHKDYVNFRDVKWIEYSNKELLSKDLETFIEDSKSSFIEIEDIKLKKEILNILPKNVIYYGVTGVGKSDLVSDIYSTNASFEKTAFSKNYTHYDFVGQVESRTKYIFKREGQVKALKEIVQEFVPGPFTKTLSRAIKDDKLNLLTKHSLIIENINKGDTSSIFKDIILLLERDNYGRSKYEISNTLLVDYINEYLDNYNLPIKDHIDKLYIPSNMNIIATINTNDKDIYSLEPSFLKHWQMKLVPIILKEENNWDIPFNDSTISWNSFLKVINDLIISLNEPISSYEDNRLGEYFIKKEDCENLEDFANIVLKHLWDNVFRLNRNKLFKSHIKTLDQLIGEFLVNQYLANGFESIFKEEISDEIY